MAKERRPGGRGQRTFTRATAVTFIRRGLLGEGRWRLRLGLFLFAVTTLRRWMERDEKIVFVEELGLGQTLQITHLPSDRS